MESDFYDINRLWASLYYDPNTKKWDYISCPECGVRVSGSPGCLTAHLKTHIPGRSRGITVRTLEHDIPVLIKGLAISPGVFATKKKDIETIAKHFRSPRTGRKLNKEQRKEAVLRQLYLWLNKQWIKSGKCPVCGIHIDDGYAGRSDEPPTVVHGFYIHCFAHIRWPAMESALLLNKASKMLVRSGYVQGLCAGSTHLIG
jgi:hypothetical protein